jgi:pSer/pThr/pTyr-binding forkhead associated (FHA) protein
MATLVAELYSSTILGNAFCEGRFVLLTDCIFSSNGTYVNGEKIGTGNKKLLQASNEIALVQGKKQGQSKVAYVYQYCGDGGGKKIEDDVRTLALPFSFSGFSSCFL